MKGEGVPFISRTMSVSLADGSGEAALELRLYAPQTKETGAIEASAEIDCPYFQHRIRMGGVDDVQAFYGLFDPVLSYLRRKRDDLDLKIWWLRDGDLDRVDFWGYSG